MEQSEQRASPGWKENFIRQQGFENPEAASCSIQYSSLLFQPRVVAVWMLAGTVLRSPVIFLLLSATLWWCALLPAWNPFEKLYNATFARYPLGKAPNPRRFAQGMAATFALVIGLLLLFKYFYAAYVLEAIMLLAIAALVFGGFCLGSFIFHVIRGRSAFAKRTLPWMIITLFSTTLICGCNREIDSPKFRVTLERIKRGEYLVTYVAYCTDCHSPLLVADPAVPDPKQLASGDILNDDPLLVAPNLTSDNETGKGLWKDSDFVRAIREGISRDGRHLSNAMPWNFYSILTDEDVISIVVYLRSLPPIRHVLPATDAARKKTDIDFPPVKPARAEDLRNKLERGKYLVRIATCENCHTPLKADQHLDLAHAFSGGRRFQHRKYWWVEISPDPKLKSDSEKDVSDLKDLVASANITPDPSGIPYYTTAVFIQTIRTGKVNGVRPLSTAMPRVAFQKMTDDDLESIFTYLKSLRAVRHRVVNSDPPSFCVVCGRRHGGGSANFLH